MWRYLAITVWFITELNDPPLFIVLKQSGGGQAAPAPAGAYMAQNRQYVLPQQGAPPPPNAGPTPSQLGLASSMAPAPAMHHWLQSNSTSTVPHQHDLDNIAAQINMLKEQITQSENNLSAQHTVSLHKFYLIFLWFW